MTNTYDPLLYDLTHPGTPGDMDFYRRICRGAIRVLELGCGSGRITRQLAKDGYSVVGLDNHPGMLKLSADRLSELQGDVSKRIQLVEGDMSNFSLDMKFDRVIIPFSGLFCLSDDTAIQDCFACARRHLSEEGLLVFDVYRVEKEDELDETVEPFAPLAELFVDDKRIEILERAILNTSSRFVDAQYKYRIHEKRNKSAYEKVYRIPQHYVFAGELEHLLNQSGLQLIEMSDHFGQEPQAPQDSICIITAKPK